MSGKQKSWRKFHLIRSSFGVPVQGLSRSTIIRTMLKMYYFWTQINSSKKAKRESKHKHCMQKHKLFLKKALLGLWMKKPESGRTNVLPRKIPTIGYISIYKMYNQMMRYILTRSLPIPWCWLLAYERSIILKGRNNSYSEKLFCIFQTRNFIELIMLYNLPEVLNELICKSN